MLPNHISLRQRFKRCGYSHVKTITASAAKNLGRFLAKDFRKIFGPAYDETAERLGSLGT
jgi:hypothetical protein